MKHQYSIRTVRIIIKLLSNSNSRAYKRESKLSSKSTQFVQIDGNWRGKREIDHHSKAPIGKLACSENVSDKSFRCEKLLTERWFDAIAFPSATNPSLCFSLLCAFFYAIQLKHLFSIHAFRCKYEKLFRITPFFNVLFFFFAQQSSVEWISQE